MDDYIPAALLLHTAVPRYPATPALHLRAKRLNARINEALRQGTIRAGQEGYHFLDTDGRWCLGGPTLAAAYECLRMDRIATAMDVLRAPRLARLAKTR